MASIIYYFFIASLATFFAYLTTHSKTAFKIDFGCKNDGFNTLYAFISFTVLFYLLAFTSSSGDLPNYLIYYSDSQDLKRFWDFYVGNHRIVWVLFNAIVSSFTDNYWIFSMFWAFTILVLIYIPLYRLRNEVSFHWSVFAISFVYIYRGISARRFILAFAIIVFGSYYYHRLKKLKFLICIIVACSVHMSAACVAIYLVVETLAQRRFFRVNRKLLFGISIIGIAIVVLFGRGAISILSNTSYGVYKIETSTYNLGLLCYYVLPYVLIYLFMNYYEKDNKIKGLWLSAIITSVCFSVMVCLFTATSRAAAFNCYLDIIYVPYIFKKAKEQYRSNQIRIIQMFYCVFVLWKFFEFFSGTAITNGLIPYTNIFGLKL